MFYVNTYTNNNSKIILTREFFAPLKIVSEFGQPTRYLFERLIDLSGQSEKVCEYIKI